MFIYLNVPISFKAICPSSSYYLDTFIAIDLSITPTFYCIRPIFHQNDITAFFCLLLGKLCFCPYSPPSAGLWTKTNLP